LKPDGVFFLNVGVAPDQFTENNPRVTPVNYLVPSLIALRVIRIGNFQLQADFIIVKPNLMQITENIYNNYEHYLMFTKTRSWKGNKQFSIPTSFVVSGDIAVHDPIKTGIPTAAIEEVVAKFVEMFSSEGDLVLDQFAGTGTTGKVAVALNRNCVLYEINESFRKIIKDKVGKAMS
jgi:DNA modification methylase